MKSKITAGVLVLVLAVSVLTGCGAAKGLAVNAAYDGTDPDYAWQFHDPDTNTGMIQVFKRENASESKQTYYLSGLDPEMTYTITDADAGVVKKATGEELMCNGWTVSIANTNEAKIYTYQAK